MKLNCYIAMLISFTSVICTSQCKNKPIFISLRAADNVIIDDDKIYTFNGAFPFEEKSAGRDEYTYDIFWKGNTIGRYVLDQEFKKQSADISLPNSTSKKELGIGDVSLEFIDSDELCERVRSYIKLGSIPLGNSRALNDKAYFLHQMGYLDAACILIEETIRRYPERVVAYLNRADIYWDMKMFEKAKVDYAKYCQLMKKNGKNIEKYPNTFMHAFKS